MRKINVNNTERQTDREIESKYAKTQQLFWYKKTTFKGRNFKCIIHVTDNCIFCTQLYINEFKAKKRGYNHDWLTKWVSDRVKDKQVLKGAPIKKHTYVYFLSVVYILSVQEVVTHFI